MIVILFHYLTERMDAPPEGCQYGRRSYCEAAPVRRGEHWGENFGNIDDSIFDDWFIIFYGPNNISVHKIRSRKRHTDYKDCSLLFVCLKIYFLPYPYSNPNCCLCFYRSNDYFSSNFHFFVLRGLRLIERWMSEVHLLGIYETLWEKIQYLEIIHYSKRPNLLKST